MFNLTQLTHLDLSFNRLEGPLPNHVSELQLLETFWLSSNLVSGGVPSWLFTLPSLQTLDLSYNKLAGQIDQIQKPNSVYDIDLSSNDIHGPIPRKNLDVLDLRSNLLQGPILSTCLKNQSPNPPQPLIAFYVSKNKLTGNIHLLICNWSSLLIIELSRNNLSGTISECFENLSSSLMVMNLEMNNFHGKMPDSFRGNNLEILLLNDNKLEGLLSRSLANCCSLKLLNLRNNKFTDTFPHWLASFPNLQVLLLRNNRLHGPMPNSLASSNFSALQIIDLSHNELTRPLPTKFFQNLRAMKDIPEERPWQFTRLISRDVALSFNDYHSVNVTTKRLEIELVKTFAIYRFMDFSNNLFCGQIPEKFGELISLQGLNLSNNNLTGPISPSIGNMIALESLDLSSNRLGGRIPSQLTNLTFLEVLNLSQNDLVGPILHGKQFDTFESDSYSGNLGLCGLPLSKQCVISIKNVPML
ncbi:PREDICTED: receptor-like protein 12 [Theobroma cacao]|uniref:Receptor-like protein 12 n=1 Tax=Theobroma cacao TaxID=3641 RepID=A0AB32WLV9_THECC|nr:PREDICTED: receptor-like protein 12 [Theobroma cacao]